MGAGGGLREGALVWYRSCLGISFRAHCWQACARFLSGMDAGPRFVLGVRLWGDFGS